MPAKRKWPMGLHPTSPHTQKQPAARLLPTGPLLSALSEHIQHAAAWGPDILWTLGSGSCLRSSAVCRTPSQWFQVTDFPEQFLWAQLNALILWPHSLPSRSGGKFLFLIKHQAYPVSTAGAETCHQLCFCRSWSLRAALSAIPWNVPSGNSCAPVPAHTEFLAEARPAPCCVHCWGWL